MVRQFKGRWEGQLRLSKLLILRDVLKNWWSSGSTLSDHRMTTGFGLFIFPKLLHSYLEFFFGIGNCNGYYS